MNLIGKWKVKEAFYFTLEEGMVWKTVDELIAAGADEDMISMYQNSVTVFCEDGKLETLMPLPDGCTQEEIDKAVAEEGLVLRDGMMVLDTKEWKTEDGKNLYTTGIQGEICGEEISPWSEIKEVGDMIEMEMIRLARVE